MEKYSQNFEQDIILNYFNEDKGTFLDIGAYDGKNLSNTHALALLDWQGVTVEPSDNVYPALEKLYKDNDNVECHKTCIGDFNGEIEFFDSGGDAISSTMQSETFKWEQAGVKFTPTVSPIITVEELLKRSKYKKFDFISIDTEGTNYEILQQINPEELGVQMLCIEWNSHPEEKERISAYMFGFGFQLVHENGENLIFTI
jgi:FkbM family methyltransferase